MLVKKHPLVLYVLAMPKIKTKPLILLHFFYFAALAQASTPLNLCYEKALRHNEEVLSQQFELDISRHQKNQTLGLNLPSAAYHHEWFFQEKLTDPAFSNAFTKSPLPEGAIQVRWPMFNGLREWLALKGGKTFIRQKNFELLYAKQKLFAQVATLYFNILLAQKNLTLNERAMTLSGDQAKTISKDVSLGRSRMSELVLTQNRYTQFQVEHQSLEKKILILKNELSSLVGEKTTDLAILRLNETYLPKHFSDLTLTERYDIQGTKEALALSTLNIREKQTGHLPHFGAAFNYYTERSGIRENIDWDFRLSVDLPLFAFGATTHAVKIAKLEEKQKTLELLKVERNAKLELQNAWDEWEQSYKSLPLLKKSLDLAEKNYKLQKNDYRLGLVTALQTLDALSELQTTEEKYEQHHIEVALNAIKLYFAQGKFPPDNLFTLGAP